MYERITALILALFFMSIQGFAQKKSYIEHTEMMGPKTDPISSAILKKQAKQSNWQKTTSSKRVIAESQWIAFGGDHMLDTTHCFYPSGYGSEFDFNTLTYHYEHPLFVYSDVQTPRYYPATLYDMDVMADSVYFFSQYMNGMVHSFTSNAVFDAGVRVVSYKRKNVDPATVHPEYGFDLHFDAFGRLDTQYIFYGYPWMQVPYTLTYKRVIEYNAQDQVVQDIAHVINPGPYNLDAYQMFYIYDASGDLIEWTSKSIDAQGNPLNVKEDHKFSYYPDHTLKTGVHASGQVNYKDSFGYTPGIPYWTFLKSGNTMNGEWSGVLTDFWKHLNSQNLPDTLYRHDDNSLYAYKTIIEYDSDGDPVVKKVGSSTFRYYYDVVNSVPEVDNLTMAVLPNPTNDWLKVKLNTASIQGLKVCLWSQLGVKSYDATLPKGTQSHEVDMRAFASGMYFLIITDDHKQIVHRQSVLKN